MSTRTGRSAPPNTPTTPPPGRTTGLGHGARANPRRLRDPRGLPAKPGRYLPPRRGRRPARLETRGERIRRLTHLNGKRRYEAKTMAPAQRAGKPAIRRTRMSALRDCGGAPVRSADFPVCRFADFPVGPAPASKRTPESSQPLACWKARETADRNVCATAAQQGCGTRARSYGWGGLGGVGRPGQALLQRQSSGAAQSPALTGLFTT